MMKIVTVVLLFFFHLHAITFSEAIEKLSEHESVDSLKFQTTALKHKAELQGSWGDPNFKIAAKNFPQDSLSPNQSPMTGVEVSLSQKIPLTSKFTTVKNAFKSMAQSVHYESEDKKKLLAKALWEIMIVKRQILQELEILEDNRIWIDKIIKVTKRLYATGKVSQQALLEIEIRKSELERDISNKKFERSQIDDKLSYLVGRSDIKDESVPWNFLAKRSDKKVDYKELSLQEKLKVKEEHLKASRQNYIPDLTVSLGYTKRSDIDSYGDFVSGSVSLKLPFSDVRGSGYAMAFEEKLKVQKDLKHYKRSKKRDVALHLTDVKMLIKEIAILENKMIKFARNSREITSKSYSTGDSSYIELLQSELKLQKILLHKVRLEAQRDIHRVILKYIQGEALYE